MHSGPTGGSRPHIDTKGMFQSDKYGWCPPDFVPLKVTDPMAADLLRLYAERRREVDDDFANDLLWRLERLAGPQPEPADRPGWAICDRCQVGDHDGCTVPETSEECCCGA